jgi:hypothetical protein
MVACRFEKKVAGSDKLPAVVVHVRDAHILGTSSLIRQPRICDRRKVTAPLGLVYRQVAEPFLSGE